jgi:hypothetical protein
MGVLRSGAGRAPARSIGLVLVASMALAAPRRPRAEVAPGSAQAEQVLAALAAVVKDRAKRVAAYTVAHELKEQICTGNGLAIASPGDPKKTLLTLRPGGSRNCRASRAACKADDVYVSTCQLAGDSSDSLTDPHFLKTLTQETVELVVRVSAADLPEERYRLLGFPALARYVNRVIEVLATKPEGLGPFAAPTFELVDALEELASRDPETDQARSDGRSRRSLVAGAKVFANLLAAYAVAPKETGTFLRALGAEARRVLAESDPVAGLKAALAGIPAAPDEVMQLRLALQKLLESEPDWARSILGPKGKALPRDLVVRIERLTRLFAEAPTGASAIHTVSSYLAWVASVIKADGAGALPGDAIEAVSRTVELAAQRDWTGLVGQLVEAAPAAFAGDTAAGRLAGFVRVLLAMVQAGSVEEAKKVFEASLEDVASRERRFHNAFTVDVAALAALRAGSWRDLESPDHSWARGGLYGVFAPFGAQLAWKSLGLMFYPVDLGAYLTGRGGGGDAPRWTDALRVGVAAYYRPWDRVPIVFGGQLDAQPRLEKAANSRWSVFAALELPLVILY